MAEHEDWTAQDDAQLRAALASLRTDVEATPLPDVRFVKARGRALRRRRFLATSAAAAAAVIVAGGIGYAAWGPAADHTPVVPATTAAKTPSPTPPSSFDQPGALPLLQEWTKALDLKGDARMTTQDPKSSDYRSFECLTTVPNGQKLRQEITLDAGGFQGGQTQFAVSSKLDPETVAEGLTGDIAQCQQGPDFTVDKVTKVDGASLYPYSAGDAGSGWFVVVTGESDVALLQVVDPTAAKSKYTLAQVTDLAEIAKARLDFYGSSMDSMTTLPVRPDLGHDAINQKMTVTGPDPVPSSNFFVAASQWASQPLTGGAKTSDGPGALEGSTAIASCETDDQQAAIGGQVGVVSIRTGTGTSGYIGRQRVQLDDAADAQTQHDTVMLRLAQARDLYAKGCEGPNYTVTSTPGPTADTFRLDTVFMDGSPTLSEWVGLTVQRDPGALSTIVITKAEVPGKAFVELDRLLALAQQKPLPVTATPSSNTTTKPPAPKTVTCADLQLQDSKGDNLASAIQATGVTCSDAQALIKAVHDRKASSGGFTQSGWSCTGTFGDPIPTWRDKQYDCRSGATKLTWLI